MCLHWKYVTVLSAEGKAEFASVPLNNTDVPSNKSVDCDKGQRTSHNQWRFVMNTYQEKFANMINKANNRELVEQLYDQCCSNCTYRFVCKERLCGVTWARDMSIERLKDNDEMLVHLHIVFPEEEKPKAYPKPKTAEEKAAKACIRFLDRVYDKTDDEELKDLIDDVTVQLCLNDTTAIDRLKKNYEVLYFKLARLWWKYVDNTKEVK